ncbi:MAG: hypothetical protein ACT4PE_15140 [Candidatus Eiseniibacteriota bacterium]
MSSNLPVAPAVLAVLLTLPWAPARAQGLNGFLPGAGHATIALSHTLESYDAYWMGGRLVADPALGRVETGSVSLWFDLGLSEDVALVGTLAYVDVASDAVPIRTAQGLQDRAFLLRYRFAAMENAGWRHSFVAGAGVRAPASPYVADATVALGDGTHDGLFRLVYQVQADFLAGAYLAAELGWDVREKDSPDGASLHGELGAGTGRVSIAGTLTRTWADGGSDIGDTGFTYPGLGGEMLRVGGKVFVRAASVLGFAASGFTTLDGRNTGEAVGTSASLVVQL